VENYGRARHATDGSTALLHRKHAICMPDN